MSGWRPAALRGVVWDVDDTLYLERDYVRSGFEAVGRHVAREHGVDGFGEALWALFEQGVRGDTFDRALAAAGLQADRDRVRALVQVYRAHAPRIGLLDDAAAAIRVASDRGLVQAAITDGPAASQRAKVRALGIAAWCNPVVITAELGPGRGKPAPDAFRAVERATGLSGPELAYVADNPAKDFVAPRALGWQTLRIRRPEGLHAGQPSGPDVDAEWPDLRPFGEGW